MWLMAINGFRITAAAACTAVAHTTVHILSTIYQTTSLSHRQRIITRKFGMVHLYSIYTNNVIFFVVDDEIQ